MVVFSSCYTSQIETGVFPFPLMRSKWTGFGLIVNQGKHAGHTFTRCVTSCGRVGTDSPCRRGEQAQETHVAPRICGVVQNRGGFGYQMGPASRACYTVSFVMLKGRLLYLSLNRTSVWMVHPMGVANYPGTMKWGSPPGRNLSGGQVCSDLTWSGASSLYKL